MFEKLKANILFHHLLKRPDINKAYKMVGPEDSWYDTITTVHNSLAQIRKIQHETVQIKSDDGLILRGIYYPNASKKTMIWVHGYTSHAERESAFPSLFYRSLGFNVLIPYLRAHGPSEGKYIALGALEYLDIMRWVDMINERIPDGEIVIHGLSMGGGIALDLATQEMKNVRCLVSDAPSVNIEGFFRFLSQTASKHNPDKAFSYATERFLKEFGVSVSDFDRVKNISQAKYPLLLSAGSNEQMDVVLNEIKKQSPMQTTVLILPGCNHGNGMYKQTEMYQSAIKDFLNRNLSL
ncbi:MAG: alpha/beta hydrolase [Oscillospiraceae bacterium]|nr:alpha/beta hydrolase [Oscillospiraceae bacterium]